MRTLRISLALAGATALVAAPTAALAQTPQPLSAADTQTQQRLIERANQLPIAADKSTGRGLAQFGTYPTRSGVILVTPDRYKGIIPTGHAGIILNASTVVESLSGGVIRRANDWAPNRSQVYGVAVRSTSSAQDEQAANWASGQVGKPYNWNYFDVNTRAKFYCSQLVWASFKDNFGINLNTWEFGAAVHPMELVNNDKVDLVYRKV